MITRKHAMTDPAESSSGRPRITPAYCAGRKLYFHPQSAEEAQFIQERLFEMGFKWREGQTHPLYVDALAHGALFLENGVMFRSSSREASGTFCDIRQLDEKYLSPDQVFMMEQFNRMAAQIEALTQKVADLESALRPHGEIEKTKRPLPPPAKGKKP
jgi:hypothetical protein